MKIKVLFVNITPFDNHGGAERVLSVIANELIVKGYEVAVLSYKIENNSFFHLSKDIERFSLNHSVSKSRIISSIKFLLNILLTRKIIKKYKPYVVIPIETPASILVAISLLGMSKIKKYSWLHYSFFAKKVTRDIIFRYFISKSFDKILILNKTDVKLYRKYFKNKVTYIPNPVSFTSDKFSSLDNNVIIAAGRLDKIKGFDKLIKAFAIVIKEPKFLNWKLEIYGSDSGEKSFLISLIDELSVKDNVYILNAVRNIKEKYLTSDIFAMSSLNECFSMVLLEAHECGLPIVSFDCNSGPRDIIKNGENGYLIEPFDINEYAIKLRLLMEELDLRKTLGGNGKRDISRFSLENIIDIWEKDILV